MSYKSGAVQILVVSQGVLKSCEKRYKDLSEDPNQKRDKIMEDKRELEEILYQEEMMWLKL
jgi:hypothetical protein